MNERLNSRSMAERYGCSRERMEQILDEIGAQAVHADGDTVYGTAEVEKLLAQRDAAATQENVGVLDIISGDEEAQDLLGEAINGLMVQHTAALSDGTLRLFEETRRTLAARIKHVPFRIRAARIRVLNAETGPARTEREFELLACLQEFRDELMGALAERRAARQQDQDAQQGRQET